jgi:hypothetical protein
MYAWKRILMIGVLALLTVKWLPAASLKAGVAKVDITPPVGVPLWGYELRDSTGTLDPLYARVLVLEAGEKRLALVATVSGFLTVGLFRFAQGMIPTLFRDEGLSFATLDNSHYQPPVTP